MIRESALFDILHRELAIVLNKTRDDESDADQLAMRMLVNDGKDGC